MKTCRECGETRPLTDYYVENHSADGKQVRCKDCVNARNAAWRAKHLDHYRQQHARINVESRKRNREANRQRQREWKARNPEKVAAHRVVARALKMGKLVRPSVCARCLEPVRLMAHHHDYSEPLEVEWICHPCHAEEHANV